MLTTQKYLIRTHKDKCVVQNGDKKIEFEIKDTSGYPTIVFEGQIGDYIEYENQLKTQLQKLNFKTQPWIKNLLYFSIPNHVSQVQRKSFLVAGDFIGASEVYLIEENLALLLSSSFRQYQSSLICIAGINKTKIEFSVIQNLEYKYFKTLYADEEIMNSLEKIDTILEQNLQPIANQFPIENYFLFFDNNKFDLNKILKLFPFQYIANAEDVILEGLKAASEDKNFRSFITEKMQPKKTNFN
ncbi:MAG: rod shape-determining protein [Saprospiraceae bacterium]|nr:rod shape-determining protein [Saprospiraceae bacterium]